MKSASRRFTLRLAAAVLSASMGPAALPALAQAPGEAAIRHTSGTTTVKTAPKKLIVLDAAALDILAALDIPVAGVPTNPLPRHLARYADPKIQRVGTLFEPNYEAIHAAKPDLVIVGGRSQAKYAEVAKIAPTIDLTVDRTDLLGSVVRNTNTLASLYGKEAQARQLLDKLHKSIDDLKIKAATAGTGLIVLTTGGKMSAYGPGSRFGVLHDAFGIQPAVPNLNTSNHGQSISFEFILKTNPDWLFVIDRDAAIGRDGLSGQRLLDNELVRQTKAWKNQRVVYLDGMNWYTLGGAGLIAMQENVDQLARALSGAR